MSTTPEFGKFTGVHGAVLIDGDHELANVMFDLAWTTETIAQERSGAYSDEHIPGKRTITCKVTGALQKAEMQRQVGYSLNETPDTGTAGVLEAAGVFVAGTPIVVSANPVTPSRIRHALSVDGIDTGGTVIDIGTDVKNNPISEVVDIPVDSIAGTNFDGTKVFKTLEYVLPVGVVSATGELQIESLAGTSTYVIGPLKVFELVGKAEDDDGNLFQVTMPDCWFKNGGLVFKGPGVLVPCDLDVDIHDADLMEVDLVVV